MIQLAKKHQLRDVIDEIALIKARTSLSRSHFSTALKISRACSALGWAIIARNVSLVAHIIARILSYGMSPKPFSDDTWEAVKEIGGIVTCLFCVGDRGNSSQRMHSWLVPLLTSPEFAFISRYAELLCQLLTTANNRKAIIHNALDLLSTSDNSCGFHVPLKFKVHLLELLKPHLCPVSINREQAEALEVIITEVKNSMRLVAADDEDAKSFLMGLNALLVQARAVSILRLGDMRCSSSEK